MLLELVILLVSLVFFLNLYVSWNDNYWLKQNIPFIEPKKVFGNIRDVIFLRKTMGEVYLDLYRKLSGKPLGGFFKLRTPILMVRDPQLIGRVLKEDFKTFHDNDIQIIRDADPMFKMSPFVSRGAMWKARRSVISPCENEEKLKSMMPLLLPICKNMIMFIKEHAAEPIEVKNLSGKYTTDIIASLAFGMECNSFENPEPQFRLMTRKLFNAGLRSQIALLCAFYAPHLGNIFKFRIIPRRVANYFTELITKNCDERVKTGSYRNDFLQEFININQESEISGEGAVYNYCQIAGHCITFLTGGFFPTASALYFCIFELSRHPEHQRKLKDEILSFGKKIEDFDYDKIKSMEYLQMVVSESLRLHPPIQTITRVCTEDTILKHGDLSYNIKQGTAVTVPVYALHLDSTYFPKPEEFNPERFTSEVIKTRPENAYLPFGDGPRCCVGLNIALMQIKVALITIILGFEISSTTPFLHMRLDPQHSFFTTAKGDVKLSFKLHQD